MFIHSSVMNTLTLFGRCFLPNPKGQLQRFYKLVSYERAVKILKNDTCITEISQVVLEISEFKLEFPRIIPKIRNFATVITIRVEQ